MRVYSIYRKPPAKAIYVGRAGKGNEGKWGNPYSSNAVCKRCGAYHAKGGETLECYEKYLREQLHRDREFEIDFDLLHGKDLVCFCAPSEAGLTLNDVHICHGQVMIKVLEERYAAKTVR